MASLVAAKGGWYGHVLSSLVGVGEDDFEVLVGWGAGVSKASHCPMSLHLLPRNALLG